VNDGLLFRVTIKTESRQHIGIERESVKNFINMSKLKIGQLLYQLLLKNTIQVIKLKLIKNKAKRRQFSRLLSLY
ncbi:MAG TPA: hypothetical protein PK612_05010, partial [Bacilli bacterium]|nr:hypothetical protein [Bacilli bacterium]